MTDQDRQSRIKEIEVECENIQKKVNELFTKLREEHPNYCENCDGRGGEISYDWGSFLEPPCHDWDPCSMCEGVNPLDVTVPMSEEEYEEMVDHTLEHLEYIHPLHHEIELLRNGQVALGESHADLILS